MLKFLKQQMSIFCELGIHYLKPLAFWGTKTDYYCKWCNTKFVEYKKEK